VVDGDEQVRAARIACPMMQLGVIAALADHAHILARSQQHAAHLHRQFEVVLELGPAARRDHARCSW
jgi:hypothetical protein